jgi:exodeoxyribonuclease V alpha subunit
MAPVVSETIRGQVHRCYFSSPTFSAGLLVSEDGDFVKFRGKFCAVEGDHITLCGTWTHDKRFGRQFDVERLVYELPATRDGLVQYLAGHPAFTGVGPKIAERLVDYAGDGRRLDQLIRNGLDELHQALRVPMATLAALGKAWVAHSDENEVRSYLAGFGLTHHQMTVLLEAFGTGVVGILRSDPYQLIRHVAGYGFKRVDKIARQMGVAKDHPGRIDAGLLYCLNEEISSGHTWTAGADLLEKANELLLLDTLDSLRLIRARADELLARGDIVADGTAVTTPGIMEAERLIRDTLAAHTSQRRPVVPMAGYETGLNAGQTDAYRRALDHVISVISGGAGTGKTFAVSRLAKAFRDAGLSVALCAPTGKAAKRIEEVMRGHGLDLEAKTIHRLLEYDGRAFRRESLSNDVVETDSDGRIGQPQPAFHVIIADEVSMVDVPLLAELLKRIDFARTRLVLVGDHNQLPPVGPGNVLRDIIHHCLAPTTVLTDVVRQAGILKANSTKVLSGVIAPTAAGDPAWTVIDSFREAQHVQVYLRDLVLKHIPERLGYDPVRQVQIITTYPSASWLRTENEPVYSPGHLEELRQFTSVLTLTFRVVK